MRVTSALLLVAYASLSVALQPLKSAASALASGLEPASPSQLAQLEADDVRTDVGPNILSIVATTYLARPIPTAVAHTTPAEDDEPDEGREEDDKSQVAVKGARRNRTRKRDQAANIFRTLARFSFLKPLILFPVTILRYLFSHLWSWALALFSSLWSLLRTALHPFFTLADNLLAPWRLLWAILIALTPLWTALLLATFVGGSMGMAAAALGGAGLVSKEWDLDFLRPWVDKAERLLGGGRTGGQKLGGSGVAGERKREAVWEKSRSGRADAPRMVDDEAGSFYSKARSHPSTSRSDGEVDAESDEDSVQRWVAMGAAKHVISEYTAEEWKLSSESKFAAGLIFKKERQ